MKKITLILFSINFLILGNCSSTKSRKKHHHYSLYKTRMLSKVTSYSIKQNQIKLDFVLYKFKDTIKTKKNINKLVALEDLKKYSVAISYDIQEIRNKTQKNGAKENIQNLMFQKNRRGYVNKLKRYFTKYQKEYREKNLQYLPDTTAWTRRYIQLLPETQRKNPPTFGEFYFKDASKEEVLLTLNMLRLAVLQEALEIQQKIIYEK